MKIRSIPQCKLLIQAKQSKSSQGTEQLKAPEISQAQLVCKSKLNQNETKVNRQHKQVNVQGTRLKACEPSHLQNKQVRQ